ncbi:MAG TPA: hypothetical protein PLS93_18795, partial [Accumulibacter sp.]|nr:hypothetical protein [Accumulibacter sp.]
MAAQFAQLCRVVDVAESVDLVVKRHLDTLEHPVPQVDLSPARGQEVGQLRQEFAPEEREHRLCPPAAANRGLGRLMSDPQTSPAWRNYRIAAGLETGRFSGPPFNDGDYLKWLEALVQVY